MGARSAAASVVRHAGGVAAEATLVAALVATVALALSPVYAPARFVAGTDNALAAKGDNHASRSGVSISIPDGPFGGMTDASVGGATGLWVRVNCNAYDGGVMVSYVQEDSSGQASIQLGPTPTWSSGGASCTGQVGYWNSRGTWVALASTTFSAY